MTRADIRELISAQLDNVLVDAEFPELPGYSRGKVRDNYDLPNGQRILVATDRQSAFDKILAAVPFKGQVLTQTARFWFEATRDIVPNHVIDHPDPNVLVARRLNMLPVEMVVRDYLTGSTSTSIWPMYEAGRRHMYGVTFADGLRKNEKLPQTIITPTTKAEQGDHDAPITPAEIVERGLLSREQWDAVSEAALAIFARGRDIAAQNGLILVDTKYEFGLDNDGRIVLADEIHTPDSSRYWRVDSYERHFAAGANPESLDKEFLRLWITERCDPYRDPIPEIPPETLVDFSARYVALFETVTGQPFTPPDLSQSIRDRVRNNLRAYVPYA
ncbi:MAG: phosphoribosylaminoimidazolesuccinocarboxamide synthase [Rhodospirillales bacterium]|nr:phosphoribosylaminoimidazolesuccinocarboxamide synthase [Rhodospirillales bacterium]